MCQNNTDLDPRCKIIQIKFKRKEHAIGSPHLRNESITVFGNKRESQHLCLIKMHEFGSVTYSFRPEKKIGSSPKQKEKKVTGKKSTRI